MVSACVSATLGALRTSLGLDLVDCRVLEERVREIACRAVIAAAAAAAASAVAARDAATAAPQADPTSVVGFPSAATGINMPESSVTDAGTSRSSHDVQFSAVVGDHFLHNTADRHSGTQPTTAPHGSAQVAEGSASALTAAMATAANRVMQEVGQEQTSHQQQDPNSAQVIEQLQHSPAQEVLPQVLGSGVLATLPTLNVDLGPPSPALGDEHHLHLQGHQPQPPWETAPALQLQSAQQDAVQALWDLADALRTLLVASASGDADDATAHGIVTPQATGEVAGRTAAVAQAVSALSIGMGVASPSAPLPLGRGSGLGPSHPPGLPGASGSYLPGVSAPLLHQHTATTGSQVPASGGLLVRATGDDTAPRAASVGFVVGSPTGVSPTAPVVVVEAGQGARISRDWEPNRSPSGVAGSIAGTQPGTSGVLPVLQPPDPSRKKSLHALASLQTQYLQALHSSTAPLYGASSSWLMGAMADVAVGRAPQGVPGMQAGRPVLDCGAC
jgi:hypothetical protein